MTAEGRSTREVIEINRARQERSREADVAGMVSMFKSLREREPSMSPSLAIAIVSGDVGKSWATVYRVIVREGLITPRTRRRKADFESELINEKQ